MKLYKVEYEDECSGSGYGVAWTSSKKEAGRERARQRKSGYRVTGTYECALKVRKEDILRFLNCHAAIG